MSTSSTTVLNLEGMTDTAATSANSGKMEPCYNSRTDSFCIDAYKGDNDACCASWTLRNIQDPSMATNDEITLMMMF